MPFSIRTFLAGLAIVLFGMDLLEDTIKHISGETLKKRLKKVANTPFKSIISGFTITSILQSSSVVSLIILAFVGAGLLTLPNAIGAIIGANVGSTILGVIVLIIGFSFNIGNFALGIIAVGGLMYKFIRHALWKNVGKIILSFGFLFYGLGILKSAIGVLTDSIDLSHYASIGTLGWFMIGIIITAILHSSGAMTIITLAALQGHIIDFPQGMLLIAGANIGTCITVIWGAMGGSAGKKQVAASHVIFNVVLGILVLLFLQPLNRIFIHTFSFPKQAVAALAFFQLFYNIVGAVIFYPFIGKLSFILQKYIRADRPHYILGVSTLELTEVDIGIPVLQKDINMLLKKIFKFNVHHLRIDQRVLLKKDTSFDTKVQLEYVLSHDAFSEDYAILKEIEEALLSFMLKALRQPDLTPEVFTSLQHMYDGVEYMMYAAKAWKDEQNTLFSLFQSDNDFVQTHLQGMKKNMVALYVKIAEIIDNTNIKENYDKIMEIISTMKEENKIFLKNMGVYLEKNSLDQGLLTALFHVSQASERSHDAIGNAIKKLFLTDEQIKYS